MAKKTQLDGARGGIFTMDGREVRNADRSSEEAEEDVVYDSMEAGGGEGGEVIELYDISAVVDGAGAQHHPDTSGSYPLATTGRKQRQDPSFDGVIDGNVTIVDAGRALVQARNGPTRHGMVVPPMDEVTPELPASAFAPGVLAFANPNHEALSQFRVLKIKVEGFIDQLQYRSIAITSTRAGEGKTSTALNLAIVMSENPWLKIALLDLNFRKPDLGRMMRAPDGDPGLLHVLSGRSSFDSALKKLEHRNLYLMHTGGQYEASMNVLNSPQFDVFLNRLYESFDLVIIDAPSVIGCDDTLVIKQKVDGVFMVLRAESTPITEMNKAVSRLGKDRILGVVLNQVRPREVG